MGRSSMKKLNSLLVTGGNGYIGGHMCRYLFEKGHEVHIVDNFSTSPRTPVHSYGEFHQIDIGDQQSMLTLLKTIRPSAVFHFAARALVPEGELDPFLYYQENLVKTINLLENCIRGQVRKFIFSSTCATFGIPVTDRLDESHPQHPINTYGHTKKLMELVMRDLAQKNLLDVVVFRYFNAAGCSPDGLIGENHEPETHLIPNLCKSALSGGQIPFQIMGTDYPTRDGTCVRDYIHVDDLAEAHFKGLHFIQDKSGFFDFNLGSENGTSVKEMVQIFKSVTGKQLQIVETPRRAGDPPQLIGDSKKAKELLGFNPQYKVEDCVAHTLNYLSKKHGTQL